MVAELTERFGRQCVPITLPIGSEDGFSGVVNLMDPGSEVPEPLQAAAEAAREQLAEAVAEADDDLITKYLEGEPLTAKELKKGLHAGTCAGTYCARPGRGFSIRAGYPGAHERDCRLSAVSQGRSACHRYCRI